MRNLCVVFVLVKIFACGVHSSSGDAMTKGGDVRKSNKPHIIVIIADDMGFNDVSFHGSNEIPTPNIDALAYNGVILNNHYTQALCTPSRSSFLTGKYPIHLGMQHLVILEPEPWGLSLNETVLPQRLKQHGYRTHAIGKWHLGFFRKEYTPTYRGFDSHFGYWQGLQDYYEHTVHSTFSNEKGYDMRRNMSIDWGARGQYSTDLFTAEAVKLIRDHDTNSPMFMYLAHLAPHTGNDDNPLQAPDEEIAKFAHIADPERRIYAAMMSTLDKSVGHVITALREKHMLENSIILFMSDNGAQSSGIHANHGSNYPFKGLKNSPWEGGMRCAAAIWSPLIKSPQRVSNQLMHITDWLPTFYSAIGLESSELQNIDGIDQWRQISGEDTVTSVRTEFVYNIDDVYKYSAVRVGDYKYVLGNTYQGRIDKWFGSSGREEFYNKYYDAEDVLTSPTAVALAGVTTHRQIFDKHHYNSTHSPQLLTSAKLYELRSEAMVNCSEPNPYDKECKPLESPCVFNIRTDPCERINLAASHPDILKELEAALLRYRDSAVPPRNVPLDPRANPANWNNTWTNWMDQKDDIVTVRLTPTGRLTPLTIGLISAASVAFLVLGSLWMTSKSCKRNNQDGMMANSKVSKHGAIFHRVETEMPSIVKTKSENNDNHYCKELDSLQIGLHSP